MKTISIFLIVIFSAISVSQAQEKKVNLFDSAVVYYKKKDFVKAFYFYDTFYSDPSNGQSNYNTYQAAVAACHAGNIEKARYFLKRSAEIGYDYLAYDNFLNDPDNTCLQNLPEWKKFIGDFKIGAEREKKRVDSISAEIYDERSRVNANDEDISSYWRNFTSTHSAKELYRQIKSYSGYSPSPKSDFWTVYHINAGGGNVPFLVYIPKGYDPGKASPLYVYLHGAVINRKDFARPEYMFLSRLEINIMKKAEEQNAFILIPFGKKDFGWLYQQAAFEMVLNQIRFVKARYHINDDRVYIGGHSNGGSGAFWYALNKPDAFASFFGLMYNPQVYGGTAWFRNMRNLPTFYGLSGSTDQIFPFDKVNKVYKCALQNGVNWKNWQLEGGHGLPFSDREAIDFVFDTLAARTRNPFPKKLEWETNTVVNGRIAWLELTALDTLSAPAKWHHATFCQPPAPRSGAVQATARGNEIDILTSRVGAIRLYLSPDMFDFSKPVVIVVNGKRMFRKKVQMDKKVMLNEFLQTFDRSFIAGTVIDLKLN